ncbi:MAG: alkaline phosphatase D family protein, partial [Acidobacteria bacterium]|nr:alkaline phosphatase D family protein [Acidobacteriota bacterium]
HQAAAGGGDLRMQVTVRPPKGDADKTWAGFELGIRGGLPGYQHALVHPATGVKAGLRGDGRLFVDDAVSADTVELSAPVTLRLEASPDGAITLSAGAVTVRKSVPPEELTGNVALAAQAPGRPGPETSGVEWGFRDWKAGGSRLAERPEQTFGPILWTQYTLSSGVLKVMALFPALGPDDDWTARLEAGGRKAEANIDRLSRTAVFRLEGWDDTRDAEYRVLYRWQDAEHAWAGRVRKDPRGGGELRVGVFSCDHGECFPQQRMVRNIQIQDPDIVFFAGDQIYEGYGGFGVARDKPSEEAMLDYLRKYWQFGWTWRSILKDRPSVVIPDDHDVFQGNIWGQAGRPLPKKEASGPGFEQGGFLMPVDWVNAVQRTQAGHLPDPVDPAPCASGIEVYFTEMRYGGASFCILEDRKFKTGPGSILTSEQRAQGRQDPSVVDVDGAEMLGARQEKFLREWVRTSKDAEFRVVLSQTIFCKATTHAGGELRRSVIDLDCGGWPQKGRRRALEILKAAPDVVMLHGDQHLGILARQGLDEWEDAALAFMVPGTSNGFPRAWRPEADKWTGRFLDGLGNRMTILGYANPEPGSNTKEGQAGLNAEEVAQIKGSGHGVVVLRREGRKATF